MFARLLCAVWLLVEMASAGAAPSASMAYLATTAFADTTSPFAPFTGAADVPPAVRDAALWSELDAVGGLPSASDNLTDILFAPPPLVDPHERMWNVAAAVSSRAAQPPAPPEPAALALLLAGLLMIGAGRFAAPRSMLFT